MKNIEKSLDFLELEYEYGLELYDIMGIYNLDNSFQYQSHMILDDTLLPCESDSKECIEDYDYFVF